MSQRNKTVHIRLNSSDITMHGPLHEFIGELQTHFANLTPEARANACVEINCEPYVHDEGYYPEIHIWYDMPMTPEEIAEDDAKQLEKAKRNRSADMAFFQKFKERYPDWRDL